MRTWIWVALVIACIAFAVDLWVVIPDPAQAGHDPMYSNEHDEQLFNFVMAGNAPGVVEALNAGANASTTDVHGCTTIIFAATYEDPTILQLLLDAGAPADPVISGEELAEVWKRTAIVDGLHKGFEMHKRQIFAPLAIAAEEGNFESVVILLEAGAKIDPWEDMDGTALDAAIHGRSVQIVSELLDWGADPNSKGRNGNAPVAFAYRIGEGDIVRLLISRGADVNAESGNGITLLGSACSDGNAEMARFLLENGANINTKSRWGTGLLDYVVKMGDIEILRLLLEYGAIPTAELLATANEGGNSEIASLLQEYLDSPGSETPGTAVVDDIGED